MNIANRLKNIRTENNITQKHLSDLLNISQSTIACYENGTREPHILSLIAYADYFECSIDYLIGRSDEIGKVYIGDSGNRLYVNDEERRLIDIYRKLNRTDKIKLDGYIDGLTDKRSPN